MLKAIGCYALDKGIETCRDFIIPFETDSYEWARGNNMEPATSEQYFWTKNNKLCGFESDKAMISVMNGKISKILYRFTNPVLENRLRLRAALYHFISLSMGERDYVSKPSFEQKILFWYTKHVNVEMNMNGNDTDLVLTSTGRKKSFFERIFM